MVLVEAKVNEVTWKDRNNKIEVYRSSAVSSTDLDSTALMTAIQRFNATTPSQVKASPGAGRPLAPRARTCRCLSRTVAVVAVFVNNLWQRQHGARAVRRHP